MCDDYNDWWKKCMILVLVLLLMVFVAAADAEDMQ